MLRWDTQAEPSSCLHRGGAQWSTILGVLVCLAKLACSKLTFKKASLDTYAHTVSHMLVVSMLQTPSQDSTHTAANDPKGELKSVCYV